MLRGGYYDWNDSFSYTHTYTNKNTPHHIETTGGGFSCRLTCNYKHIHCRVIARHSLLPVSARLFWNGFPFLRNRSEFPVDAAVFPCHFRLSVTHGGELRLTLSTFHLPEIKKTASLSFSSAVLCSLNLPPQLAWRHHADENLTVCSGLQVLALSRVLLSAVGSWPNQFLEFTTRERLLPLRAAFSLGLGCFSDGTCCFAWITGWFPSFSLLWQICGVAGLLVWMFLGIHQKYLHCLFM